MNTVINLDKIKNAVEYWRCFKLCDTDEYLGGENETLALDKDNNLIRVRVRFKDSNYTCSETRKIVESAKFNDIKDFVRYVK